MKLLIGKATVLLTFATQEDRDAFLTTLGLQMRTPEQISLDVIRNFGDPSESLEQG